MEIVVSYEEASKNGDMSALTCFKSKNKYAFEMVVGAVSDEADEILKIVSEQGYLKKHDSELIDKFVTRLKDYFVIPHDILVIEQMAKELKAEVRE